PSGTRGPAVRLDQHRRDALEEAAMCTGGRLLSDFRAGSKERPRVPAEIERCLTQTIDGTWVIWAYKVDRPAADGQFRPLSAGVLYPTDAVAACLRTSHHAPQPNCSCGFHAVSDKRHVPGVGTGFAGSSA